jgi:hypothetical protein
MFVIIYVEVHSGTLTTCMDVKYECEICTFVSIKGETLSYARTRVDCQVIILLHEKFDMV